MLYMMEVKKAFHSKQSLWHEVLRKIIKSSGRQRFTALYKGKGLLHLTKG
jgi:hypothetical protein